MNATLRVCLWVKPNQDKPRVQTGFEPRLLDSRVHALKISLLTLGGRLGREQGKGTESGEGLVGMNKNPVELEQNGLGSGMRVGGDEAGNAWDESMKYL